jgi:hypothetical protein
LFAVRQFIFTGYLCYLPNLLNKITNWEAWPFKMMYWPILPVWFSYAVRLRAAWFFTPSNPKLTFGGLDGEPKKEMYDLLPKESYPTSFNVLPATDFDTVEQTIIREGIHYPLVVKPEIGCAGVLFRKIDNAEELKQYHEKIPVEYIVQQMVTYPMEVSVFYMRHPLEKKGTITGFLHKIPMQVVGDGEHTLEQLIHLHDKASKRTGELHSRHKEHWTRVLAKGERYMLSHAANHNRGAHFVDLKDEIDDQLLSIFDEISFSINDFFYGRYDILCNSVEDLKQRKNYKILEYNGCGAEPNHIYDSGYSLGHAQKEILRHWNKLFEICRYNSSIGIKPWPFWKGLVFRIKAKRHMIHLKKIDKQIA